jgi:acyl transferase domain-containing protein
VAEAFEAAGPLGGGLAGQVGVFVGVDHGEVVLTA